MPREQALRARGSTGFTLIELMVAVAIATLLVAIALPSYRQYVLQSHRAEAKTSLLDLAGREERYFNSNVSTGYTASSQNLGYGAAGFPMTVGSGYYQVNVAVTAAVAGPPYLPPTYTLTATAIGNQVNDASCQTFTVLSTGQQTSAPAASGCW